MNNKTTVMIHVDALRHDYVTSENMPFLYSLAKNGISARLVPPFGFEPDGAYLTGKNPEDYNGGTHFVYNDVQINKKSCDYLLKFLDQTSIYLKYPLHKMYEKWVARKSSYPRVKKSPYLGQIPFQMLRYFDYCEKYYTYEPQFAGKNKTIFDLIREQELSFFYYGFPKYKCKAQSLIEHLEKKINFDYRFIFLFIDDLDGIGHIYGPRSKEIEQACNHVDNILKRVYERIKLFYNEIDFIAFGDHGMLEIDGTINFLPYLKSLPLKTGKDYIYFLDSTFARFWVKNSEVEKLIINMLNTISGGQIIDKAVQDKYHINYRDRKFGDIIFWCNGGKIIYPNFWQVRNIPKGMHGYRKEEKNNHAYFVYNNSNNDINIKFSEIEMSDVFSAVVYSIFGVTNSQSELAMVLHANE